MINIKRNNFFKSYRFPIIVISAVVIALLITAYFIFFHKGASEQPVSKSNDNKPDTVKVIQADLQNIGQSLDKKIDSVLSTFGIKKEWIATLTTGTKQLKSKTDQQKKIISNAQWFTKNVLIPEDLTSAEINLDLTNLIRSSGLFPLVNEDIRTTDIDINIFNDSASSTMQPLVKISINHSDKITRESGTIVVILSSLNDMKKDQADEILSSTSEFSFILPRNLEDIELQNKLVHDKKDLIINLTIGEKEAVETDFSLDMADKDIKQKVKSFNVDFPSVKYVLLSTSDPNIQKDRIYSKLTDEFARFEIKSVSDTLLFKFPDLEINSSKVPSVINTLKARAENTGKVITVLSLDYDAFKTFYNEVLTLKKQGFKFYNFSQYLSKEASRQMKEKLLKEKQEEDAKKKKETKPSLKDKKTVKKETKSTKDSKLKTNTKKQTQTKKK